MSHLPHVLGKFRGCLLGSLIGDCFGSPFENEYENDPRPKAMVIDFLLKMMERNAEKAHPRILDHTDDTAMMRSVALSLIENNGYNAEDMAKKFTEEYFQNPRMGYGLHVIEVFKTLKAENFTNIYEPARNQFDGTGSYGNGGSMRVAPVALYYYNSDHEELIDIARKSTMLTHTHRDGINGAILQCLAVELALKSTPSDNLDPDSFLDRLIEQMDKLETEEANTTSLLVKKKKPFCSKLTAMKKVLKDKNITDEEISEKFGNDISALGSVPIAIFAFLRGQKSVDDFETFNPFLRTLYLSIRLGGDTDTIACMACGIAGAYYGTDMIPDVVTEKCKEKDTLLRLADGIFNGIGLNK